MKKVMCFGTFDKLHPGHLSYLTQAKKYGDYLIVVVARDKNVLKLKGNNSHDNEKTRLEKIKKLILVDKAVFGNLRDKFKVIVKYQPDIICLGYDQRVDLVKLKKIFAGEVIRLKPFKPYIYKSSKL